MGYKMGYGKNVEGYGFARKRGERAFAKGRGNYPFDKKTGKLAGAY